MASIHVIVERVYRGPSAYIDLGGAEGRARARARSPSDYNVANADAPARRQSRVTANRAPGYGDSRSDVR